jgi:hypothetical protein
MSSILKGIENAKGSPDAISLLTEEDLFKIGEELANREAYRKTEFFSVVVDPINEIEEGKKTGHYDSIDRWITPKTVLLQKSEGAKRIYFVPVNERVPEGKEAEFLSKFGKKPVTNAPNYLLGAMVKLEEKDLPEELKLKDFVAVSSDDTGVFLGGGGTRCFLRCNRRSGYRRLDMIELANDWRADYGWFFLAEEI